MPPIEGFFIENRLEKSYNGIQLQIKEANYNASFLLSFGACEVIGKNDEERKDSL